MDSKKSTEHLIQQMTADTEKQPDPRYDQVLVELLNEAELSDAARTRMEALLDKYFKLFGDDMGGAYSKIIDGVSGNEFRQSEEYLHFLSNFMEEAASFGFPSIFDVFAPTTQELARVRSGHEIFDIRNLFLLRIYIADLIMQVIPLKAEQIKQIKEQLQQASTEQAQQDLLSRLAAVIGTMRIPIKGIVDANAPQTFEPSDPGSIRSFSYSRDKLDTQLIPDAEREKALVALGERLGRADHANRGDTFSLLKENEQEKLKLLFPDLFDDTVTVSDEHKAFIERALALSYPKAKQLFADQLDQDSK